MKFIIPKNYKFKNKIFGIIDYPTAIINLVFDAIIYFILKKMSISMSIKIFIFTTLTFPILLFTILGFNNESPIQSIICIIKFIFKQKVYLFKKEFVDI